MKKCIFELRFRRRKSPAVPATPASPPCLSWRSTDREGREGFGGAATVWKERGLGLLVNQLPSVAVEV